MKTRIFNSSLYLLVAYYLVHFTYLVFQNIFLNILNVKNTSLLFFYNVFSSPENVWWSRFSVFLIYGGGFMSVILLLFIFLILFIKLSKTKYKLFLFYQWVILVCFAFIIAELFSAAFFGDLVNLYNVMIWINIEGGGGGMFIIAIISLLLIPIVAYLFKGNFLKLSKTTQYIKTKNNRLNFYFKTAIIPFLVLCLVMMSMVYLVPSYDFKYVVSREITRLIMLGIILLVGTFFIYNKNYITLYKSNNTNELDLATSLLFITGMLAIFVILYLNH